MYCSKVARGGDTEVAREVACGETHIQLLKQK